MQEQGPQGTKEYTRSSLVEEDSGDSADSSDDQVYTMFTVKDPAVPPIFEEVHINNVPVNMELDTGASFSVVTQATYQRSRSAATLDHYNHLV